MTKPSSATQPVCTASLRKQALSNQFRSYRDGAWVVDAEYIDGDSAYRRHADEFGIVPSEVVGPHVAARVIETDYLAGVRIDARDVGAFPFVASEASER